MKFKINTFRWICKEANTLRRSTLQDGSPNIEWDKVEPSDDYECLGMCVNSTKADVLIALKCVQQPDGMVAWVEEGKVVSTEDIIKRADETKDKCEAKCPTLPDVFDWECTSKMAPDEILEPGTPSRPGHECDARCKNTFGKNTTSVLTVECKLDSAGKPMWHDDSKVISVEDIVKKAKECPCEELPDYFAWKCSVKGRELTAEQIEEPPKDGRKCKGYCFEENAANTSVLIELDCVLKGNVPNWQNPKGEVVTMDDIKLKADEANTSECKPKPECTPLPDSLFKWSCTLGCFKKACLKKRHSNVQFIQSGVQNLHCK